MDREYKVTAPKISRASRITAYTAGAVALFAAVACGGGESKSNPNVTPSGDVGGVSTDRTSELLTATAIVPTSVPEATSTSVPEATPTVEPQLPVPTFGEVTQLISEAYAGRTFEKVTYPEFQTAAGVNSYLKKCLSNGETITTGNLVFEPGTPNYRTALLGGCQRAGEATKEIYNLTGEKAAYEANQVIFRVYTTVFEEVRLQAPVVDPSFLDAVKQRFFTLTPPAK